MTMGTGRMRHMKEMPRRFKNGFREGASEGATREFMRRNRGQEDRCRIGLNRCVCVNKKERIGTFFDVVWETTFWLSSHASIL
jgi:hypothetical protein